jgi:peptidase M23-like protein
MVAAALIAGVGIAGASTATAGGLSTYLSSGSSASSSAPIGPDTAELRDLSGSGANGSGPGADATGLSGTSANGSDPGADATGLSKTGADGSGPGADATDLSKTSANGSDPGADATDLSNTSADAIAPGADGQMGSPAGTSAGIGLDDRAGSATDVDGRRPDDLDGGALGRLAEMPPPRGEARVGATGRARAVAGLSRPRKLSVTGPLLGRSGSRIQPLPATRWVNPLPGAAVTSCFGMRWGRLHAGIDLSTTAGTPIRAAGAGVVIAAGAEAGYGNAVLIDHGSGFLTHYGHMSMVTVRPGQPVAAGERIGNEGSTGHSTGPHLHFEVHRGAYKNPIEPARWMREHGVTLPGCGQP